MKLIVKFFFVLLVFSNGCKNKIDPRLDIDVSTINHTPNIVRFETELLQCETFEDVQLLDKKYPYFTAIYLDYIMPKMPVYLEYTQEQKLRELYHFIGDMYTDSLLKMCSRKFKDFKIHAKELTDASKRITYFFPEDSIKNIYTFASSFDYGGVFLEDEKSFAIGLDMFMGADFEIYKELDPERFPKYRLAKFAPHYLSAITAITYLHYKVPKTTGHTFMDEAIYQGKILYGLDALLPTMHDSLKIQYSNGQLEWNIANEKNIWAYLIQEEILFNNDKNLLAKNFFNDAPFTTPFGPESTPRIGMWIGWQIVRAYMKKHPEISIKQLFENQNHLDIFQQSGYKP